MSYDFRFGAQQGWQCPICGAVYSPSTPMCYNCTGKSKTYTVSTGTSETNTTCPYYKGVCALDKSYVCYSKSSFKGCEIYEKHCEQLLKEMECDGQANSD